MTLSTTNSATAARDGDETVPRHCGPKLTNSRLHNNYNHHHHSQRHNLNLPTRRSIFLEEGGGEGVEHELGGEHDFVDLSASPSEDFSSYQQHFDDNQSLMMMTHTSPPSTTSCNNDSSASSTNNVIASNRSSSNSINTSINGSAPNPDSVVTDGGQTPLIPGGDQFRETNTTQGGRQQPQPPKPRLKHAHQPKQQEQQPKESDHHQCEDSETTGTNNASNNSSCLVQTGDHTYRIPDGEKCTVKVGDKIRIIHGPAILNFASSDGLMTSVTGGDVPKLSKFRSSEITSLHLCPSDAKAELDISASLGSSPNRSDDDGSGRHSEDQSNFDDCKSRDEMIGYESPSKMDKMGDCFRNNSCRPLFQNGTFGEHQTIDFEGLCNSCVHDGTSESRKHNNNSSKASHSNGHLQYYQTGSKVDGGAASVQTAERDSDAALSRMLHVDIEMAADLSLSSSANIKSSNSRHVSPCSEKSHDSSYSSSSCGSSKSPDVLSPVNQNRAAVNKRTKRKVKLVPYQDTNGVEYIDKVKWALSSLGTPCVTDLETSSAKVAWSGCNKNLFPGGDQSSSTHNITHKVCYNLSYGKQIENKSTINCGSQTEYILTSLSPGQCYELFVWANLDDIQGNSSPVVTFSTRNSPPSRPNAPILKSASKNSLVVAWQPGVSSNQNGGGKNIIYKLFAAEESQVLDLTSSVVKAASGATKHGAISSSSHKKNKGGNVVGCPEYDSHLRYEGCQRSAKIDHLNPNSSYKFQLIVCNSEGCSEPSGEVVFTTLSVQPPQPDPPTLVYRDTYNIRLNWKSYLNKHSALLGKLIPEFTLQMEDQMKLHHGFVTQYSGPETCYTVANLPRSSKFKFKLFAEIGCLKSAASEPVVFSTRDCVPHAPTGLNCTDITSNKCTLRWERPIDDGGSEVTQYIVERSISGGLFQEIYHGVDTCLPISSLFPGMEYHFRVAAENSVGRGMFSTSCPCHTKPVVPAQCSHPNVSGRIKPHSVHIAWSPPDYDGGSRILQYAVKQITDLSKPSDGFEISRDVRRDLIVFQLSPGTVYGFSVCAINSVGRGPWSVPLEVQTAPDKPPAPEPPRVVFSPKSSSSTYARITWCTPSFDNGSPITEYRLEGCEDTSIVDADMASLSGHLEPFSVAAGCPAISGASMSDHMMETHYAISSCSTPVGSAGSTASSKHVQQQHSSSYSSASSSNRHSHSVSHLHQNHHAHHHHHLGGPQQPLAAGVPASIPTSKRNNFNNSYHQHHDSSSSCNNINNINSGSSGNDRHHRSGNGTPLSMLARKSNSHSQSGSTSTSNVAAGSTSVAPAPTWFQLYRGVKLSFDYKSIKPATAYKFRVQAVNNIGASAYSKETFIMSPCSAPSAVMNVNHEATVDSIQLTWDVPECNGAPILSYYIDCSSPAQLTNSSTSSTSRSSNHHNSAAASSYETVSSSSTSRNSNNSNSLYSSLQHNQLEQSSTSANQNRSSSPNISFQRRTSNDDKTWQPHSFYECDSNSYVINNLRADTFYKIRVRACNENGNGPFSTTVKVQTLCLPPEPPLLECVSSTASSLRLRWGDASASSGSASGGGSSSSKEITYHLQMEDKSGRFQNTYSGSAVSYRVIRLQELTSYTFRINASNEAGHGPFSQLYCFSTTKSPPSPPMKAPKVKVVKDPLVGYVEASWIAANPFADDKVLYQLMIATGPSSNEFVVAYKGSETNCRIENLLKNYSGRSQNQSGGGGHNDFRLKVCAIRQCQDDKQEIFGQYSPLCSFQYTPFINSNCNQNQNNNHQHHHYLANNTSSSSLSAHHNHNNHVSSYRGGNLGSNYTTLPSATSEMSSSAKQSHVLYDSALANAEVSEGAICKGVFSLGSSRLGCALKRKVSEWGKVLTEFHPNDTQIAIMVLIVFVVVLIAIAVYIQQTFTAF